MVLLGVRPLGFAKRVLPVGARDVPGPGDWVDGWPRAGLPEADRDPDAAEDVGADDDWGRGPPHAVLAPERERGSS